MKEQIQEMLDTVENQMKEAQQRTYSVPAGTRVLYVLVTLLSKQCLTGKQQQQVETLLDMHAGCFLHNGEVK